MRRSLGSCLWRCTERLCGSRWPARAVERIPAWQGAATGCQAGFNCQQRELTGTICTAGACAGKVQVARHLQIRVLSADCHVQIYWNNCDKRAIKNVMMIRKMALTGHELWANWAAKALGAQLHSSMQSDPALVSNIPLRNWTETVVKHVRPPRTIHFFILVLLLPEASSVLCCR